MKQKNLVFRILMFLLTTMQTITNAGNIQELPLGTLIQVPKRESGLYPVSASTRERKTKSREPFSQDELNIIAKNCKILYQPRLRANDLDPLHAKNPDLIITSYMTGHLVKGGDSLNEYEQKYRRCLCMTPGARLTTDIDAETTTFVITAYSQKQLTKTGTQEKSGIPIYASTVSGKTSEPYRTSSENFVYWIRVDDEFMRVEHWDPKTATIKVSRGFDGTTVTAHSVNSLVFVPLYTGSSRSRNTKISRPYPHGGRAIGYLLDMYSDRDGGWQIKAERVAKAIEKGFDGMAIDLVSAGFPLYDVGDCFGRSCNPWNFETNTFYTVDEWISGYQRFITYLREYTQQKTGKRPYLSANGLSSTNYPLEKNGGERLLLQETENNYTDPLDARIGEHALSQTANGWKKWMPIYQSMAQKNQGARLVIGDAKWLMPKGTFEPKLKYCYCSYLLAVEKEATNFMLGASFWQYKDANASEPTIYFPDCLFWDIGYPVESVAPGEFQKYQVDNLPVYKREFENGLVFIYPEKSGAKYTINLDKKYIDPVLQTVVDKITIKPHEGIILLKSNDLVSMQN